MPNVSLPSLNHPHYPSIVMHMGYACPRPVMSSNPHGQSLDAREQ